MNEKENVEAMSEKYNFAEIEKKWQQIWEKEDAFRVTEDPDKKKYYVGFENSRKQKKEGTRIKELTDLAMNAADFTESDIVQRNTKMIFDFVEFMNNNGLLSED